MADFEPVTVDGREFNTLSQLQTYLAQKDAAASGQTQDLYAGQGINLNGQNYVWFPSGQGYENSPGLRSGDVSQHDGSGGIPEGILVNSAGFIADHPNAAPDAFFGLSPELAVGGLMGALGAIGPLSGAFGGAGGAEAGSGAISGGGGGGLPAGATGYGQAGSLLGDAMQGFGAADAAAGANALGVGSIPPSLGGFGAAAGGAGALSGAFPSGGMGGLGGAGAGGGLLSGLGSILGGSGGSGDYSNILKGLLQAGGGYLAADAQGDAFRDVSRDFMALGGPSRDRFNASFAPGFDLMQAEPGLQGALDTAANTSARALSTRFGNPADSMTAQGELQKYLMGNVYLPQLNTYRSQNLTGGGLGVNQAGTGSLAGAQSSGGMWEALGAGAQTAMGGGNTLDDLFKKYGMGGQQNNFGLSVYGMPQGRP